MADDIWTVKRILAWIEDYLAQHGDDKPLAAAQWLVSDAIGVSRMQLYLDPERPLTSEERAVLRDYTKRRATGEPLQYITGTTDFRYITLKVRKGVLIPRPETEVLVSEALALLPVAQKRRALEDDEIAELLQKDAESADGETTGTVAADGAGRIAAADDGAQAAGGSAAGDAQAAGIPADGVAAPAEVASSPAKLLVADIGTGTGCIACSLAKEHPRVHVVATDVSSEAAQLARENVAFLGLEDRVRIVECDLGEGIEPSLMGAFDLVVSNPPYVPTSVLAAIPREVADFEPMLALDGGEDGLDVFRRLLDWARLALKPGGALVVELHETCLEDAAAEAEYAGFADARIVKDLAGRPRVITAVKR